MTIRNRSIPGRVVYINVHTLSTMSRIDSIWGKNKAKTGYRITEDIKEVKRTDEPNKTNTRR